MTSPAARLIEVGKTYQRGSRRVIALQNLSLELGRGEFLSITGPSGSGKSTLLNLVAGLDEPSSGEIQVENQSLSAMDDDARTEMRQLRVGIIFQFFNLLPALTALNNVALPLRGAGRAHRESIDRARKALDLVGLLDRLDHRPMELSGGEMQRVAIARALVINPSIILADEPTGNLDTSAGIEVLDLLRRCNRDRNVAVILVTHSPSAAAYAERVVTLRDGRLVDETLTRPPKDRPSLRPVP